ncbi:hypothetical protein D3C86_1330370 [compost metagenome]
MLAGAIAHGGQHPVQWPGLLVRATHAQGVKHIGDGHDPRCLGDPFAGLPCGVTRAIPLLVVMQGNLRRHAKDGGV